MKGYYLRRWASETLKFSSKHIELVQQHSKRENLINIWLQSVSENRESEDSHEKSIFSFISPKHTFE